MLTAPAPTHPTSESPDGRAAACSTQIRPQLTEARWDHTGGTSLRTASAKHKRGTRWVMDNSGGQWYRENG